MNITAQLMNKLLNPVILHGPGRSGTTLTYKILSRHDKLYWISNYVNHYPKLPSLSLLSNLNRIKWIERYTRYLRRFPEPSEAYGFWTHFYNNYYEDDDTPHQESTQSALLTLNKISKYSKGSRFITKFTGRPRAQHFSNLFFNPIIIWIQRDPVSVIASYYKNKWFYKKNVNMWESHSKGHLIDEYVEYYIKIHRLSSQLDKFDIIRVNYEDLIEDRISYFQRICEFTGLEWNFRFEKVVNEWKVYTKANQNFKKYFTREEIDYIRHRISTALPEHPTV